MAAQQSLKCKLCPKECKIGVNQSGECRVRVNIDGKLKAVTYGFPCAVHIDPVEKKPLFHFYPGNAILSVATVGCNLHCRNCQNWEISQANPEETQAYFLPPEKIVGLSLKKKIPLIAYTYTEPLIYYEYTYDTSVLARKRGLKNVLVTAGFLNQKPLKKLYPYIDAANIDLKFFDNKLYEDVCDAQLAPVLNALVLAKEMNLWVEVTNLIIPTLNDDDKMVKRMCKWIVKNLGTATPLHFSRFIPRYKLKYLPPTPVSTLERAYDIARQCGLEFVYIGNVYGASGENTFCPVCGEIVIKRIGYNIGEYNLKGNKCVFCNSVIDGVFL
jgi:pyruvate formate lyase activating enzyme